MRNEGAKELASLCVANTTLLFLAFETVDGWDWEGIAMAFVDSQEGVVIDKQNKQL